MFEATFSSLYGASESVISNVTTIDFLFCTVASIVLGMIAAAVYMFRHDYSKNFVVTLALLPVIVQMVITLVNGNLGAGIAVMGVFNLVRFRSIAGTAKDIGSVFMAMAIGLATGMGYIGLAVLFTIIVAIINIVFVVSPFGNEKTADQELKITVPEDLAYTDLVDPVLARWCSSAKLQSVETTNLGSLFQLRYKVSLKEPGTEKSLIDDLRTRNGNLKIAFCLAPTKKETL